MFHWAEGSGYSMDGIDRRVLLLARVFSENTHESLDDVIQGVRSSLLDESLEVEVRVQLTRVGAMQQYMIAEVGDACFVTLPGTRGMRDLLVDGNVSRRKMPWTRDVSGYVHGGFLEQSLSIPIEELYRHFVCTGGKRLILCGHSLGGALAVLCTMRMLQILDHNSRDLIRCFTFGSPGVGDEGVKRYVQGRGWGREIINIVVDDDPIAYLTGYYKHIGNVIRFKRTGALMLGKHRMRNYSKHVSNSVLGLSGGQAVSCGAGVLVASPQVVRIVCRSGSRYIFIEGENLGFVTHVGIVHPASGDARVGLCKILEKTHARLVAWYDGDDTRPFCNECCEPHMLFHTDFHTSSFPVRVIRSVVWVLSVSGEGLLAVHHSLLHGADVWDVTTKVLSGMNNMVSMIKSLSLYLGARLEHRGASSQLRKMKGHLSHVLKDIPDPDCILIHSNGILDDIFYHALYPLSGRLTVLLSHTGCIGAELKRKIKTLSGVQDVLDHSGVEASIDIFVQSQQQKLQYQHSRL